VTIRSTRCRKVIVEFFHEFAEMRSLNEGFLRQDVIATAFLDVAMVTVAAHDWFISGQTLEEMAMQRD